MSQLTPEVLWAQRSSSVDPEKNFIYLTISVPDVPKESLKLDLKPTTLIFSGYSNTLKREYSLNLEFYAEIDPEASQVHHTARNVELKLRKKELKEEYWPRLLKEAKKVQFLKTDFDKWVDEDEQNEAPEDDFSQFGGAGMGGMPGMGGGDFGGIDFSKLGGAGGLPGGLGDEEEEEDEEDDDDDMPALEGEEDSKAAAKPSA
ncbi:HSP20-like chaperone [Microdochium trichocladiopsis]|uniref:HSP20-like chaperone n=1 Tax=Microdochium trichocladiopsis TaxID=1682393 RepID=A0A9P9BW23_9PEZI|nr:HSP20-like chaperone [Microdochium trichocladiopsis]KAH7040170.1 HSP20-like chaperone [Microdochium trichocladiopsis]